MSNFIFFTIAGMIFGTTITLLFKLTPPVAMLWGVLNGFGWSYYGLHLDHKGSK